MSFIRIAGAALNQTPLDWENNVSNIKKAISLAKAKNVQILCLPELCITGYGCEDLFLSEWLPEKAMEKLYLLKEECDGITVAIGLPVILDQKVYNCCAVIKDTNILGIYAKQFLAKTGVHYETRWFTPWEHSTIKQVRYGEDLLQIGDITFDLYGVSAGFEICEDAWVDDMLRPACRYKTKGVQLILNPSASHFAFEKSDFRYNLISRSSKNFDCTYLYANLLGNEAGRMIYDGEVLIYHKGELIQRNDRLSFNDVNLVYADINFVSGETSLEPLTHDDRSREFEFWEATTLGLFDYMRKSRSKGFVLSLSGGADSSACAVMVSEMVKKGIKELGIEAFLRKCDQITLLSQLNTLPESEQAKVVTAKILTCAYQASKNSGPETLESAAELANSIGATFYSWHIDKEVEGYTKTIEEATDTRLSWEQHDITLQNIQARARSPIIWMLSNMNNALLITTSNRSEGDVGYATMDGDTSGSIAPIAGVDKHFIRNWLIWAEENLGQKGLKYVNALIPTAELRPPDKSQTDEKDLMPYDILVDIERLAIRDRKSPLQVYISLKQARPESADLLKKYIDRFFRLWARNQWKRERIAPSFHLDEFNVDPKTWCRFPILSSGFSEELRELQEYQ